MPDAELWELRQRRAVEELLLDYCALVDALDIDRVAELFTADCVFDFGYGRTFQGRDQVREIMSARLADYSHTSHHLTNLRIRFDGRDRATANSYVYAWHRQVGDAAERQLWGRYFDDLELIDGRWQIARRRIRAAAEQGYPPAPGKPSSFELIPRRGRVSG